MSDSRPRVASETGVMSRSAQFATTLMSEDDLDLVHASQGGDVAAFEELVNRYDRRLLRIAQHMTDSAEDAEEVVQEAFFESYEKLNQFQGSTKFSTWLIRTTVNQSQKKLRKRRTARELARDSIAQVDDHDLPIDLADWVPNLEQLYGASELRKILIESLQELGPGLRTVFVLREVEGLSTGQTAEILGLNDAAVKSRLFRARLQLRERLSRYFRKPDANTCTCL
jgi:RNA polymerase sigma-70 factor, ECF subfamily